MKRYNIVLSENKMKYGEEKPLTEQEREKRKNNIYYCKNGKPKKSYMMCERIAYKKEVGIAYGHQCAGNRCCLYSRGCDNHGLEWKE